MKFTLIKDLRSNALMRYILLFFSLFIALYLLLDSINHANIIGTHATAIKHTIFGNEEEFLEPISYTSLLEYAHQSIFTVMMLLFTQSAIFIRLFAKRAYCRPILHVTMISALLTQILLLSLPLHPSLVYLYITGFYLWHLLSLVMSIFAIKKLV